MCTTYGTKMTGIARYARMLYAFWISVSRPNCAMRKSAMQQARAARIWVRLILPAVSVLLLRSARPAWIRFDHGGNHVDGCGYGTEDDQYGNQRCHEFTADALLNHK